MIAFANLFLSTIFTFPLFHVLYPKYVSHLLFTSSFQHDNSQSFDSIPLWSGADIIASIAQILFKQSFNQSSNQNLYCVPSRYLLRYLLRSAPRLSGKEQFWEGGGFENRRRLGGVYLSISVLEVHSALLDQPQKKNGPALQQSRQIG